MKVIGATHLQEKTALLKIKNDLSGNVEYCMDAIDFLKSRKDNEFDGHSGLWWLRI